ncbi:MAG: hypothetical protein FWF18_00850 [Dehalococcoidia bacterium]|nr:hypothetical protein [Dehalococcoidia bacterium]
MLVIPSPIMIIHRTEEVSTTTASGLPWERKPVTVAPAANLERVRRGYGYRGCVAMMIVCVSMIAKIAPFNFV